MPPPYAALCTLLLVLKWCPDTTYIDFASCKPGRSMFCQDTPSRLCTASAKTHHPTDEAALKELAQLHLLLSTMLLLNNCCKTHHPVCFGFLPRHITPFVLGFCQDTSCCLCRASAKAHQPVCRAFAKTHQLLCVGLLPRHTIPQMRQH